MSKVKIGIVGSRFQADCIAASVAAMPDEAEVVAVASPTPGNAEAFARRHGIGAHHTSYQALIGDPAVELVVITAPNRLHAEITIAAARAGAAGVGVAERGACRLAAAAGDDDCADGADFRGSSAKGC